MHHLRSVVAAREAELMELRAISETKPNLAEVKVAFELFREAQANEEEHAKVADACFTAARASRRSATTIFCSS